MFPTGSRVVDNPHGTAPGIDLTWSDGDQASRLFALPGVPAEMIEMWRATVRPAAEQMAGPARVICHRCIKCFGTGESHLESLLPDLIRRGRDPRVGITAHRATITLRVSTSGADSSDACERMGPTLTTIRECLGELVFGEGDDELEDVVIRLLRRRGQSLAVCELGTQGVMTRWLNAAMSADRTGEAPLEIDIPPARDGAADVFRAGLVMPNREGLEALLGQFSAQDPEALVQEAAERLRARFGTDLALVTGPPPDLKAERPRIAIGLADRERAYGVTRSYGGHPDVVLDRAAKQALDLMRIYLLRGTIR
jgi:nicotinamide-nucleotide amidase